MESISKSQQKNKDKQKEFYESLEEWETMTFPKLSQKKERKELEDKPEAIGTAIANEILHELLVEFADKF